MRASKAELLAKTRRGPVARRVESLDDTFNFRRLSLAERDAYESRMFDSETGKVTAAALIGVRSFLVATSVVGDNGEQLFTEEEVATFDGDIALEMHDIALDVNGMKKNAVQDAAGKSPPTGDTTSD